MPIQYNYIYLPPVALFLTPYLVYLCAQFCYIGSFKAAAAFPLVHTLHLSSRMCVYVVTGGICLILCIWEQVRDLECINLAPFAIKYVIFSKTFLLCCSVQTLLYWMVFFFESGMGQLICLKFGIQQSCRGNLLVVEILRLMLNTQYCYWSQVKLY